MNGTDFWSTFINSPINVFLHVTFNKHVLVYFIMKCNYSGVVLHYHSLTVPALVLDNL